MNIIGIIIATVICLFLSYTGFTWLANILYFKRMSITFDYSLLFFRGNMKLFIIATLLAFLPIFYYASVKIGEKLMVLGRSDRKDFNKKMNKFHARKLFLPVTFNSREIVYPWWDRMYIKLFHPKKYQIGDKKEYKRAGLPVMSSKNRMWVDSTDSHSLILGTTNSGKTVTIILPLINMVRMAGESAVIVDLKGELSQMTYDDFIRDGYRVYVLDFIDPQKSDGWNPLQMASEHYYKEKEKADRKKEKLQKVLDDARKEYVRTYGTAEGFDASAALGRDENGNPYFVNGEINTYPDYSEAQSVVEDVANAICSDPNSKDQVWNNWASDILKGLIYLLLEEGDPEEVNIPSAKAVLDVGSQPSTTDAPNSYGEYPSILNQYVKLRRTPNDMSYVKLNTYLDSSPDTAKSMRSTFNERIDKVLLSQQVQNIMATNEINLPDLDRQKTVIFLKVHDEKSTYYPLVNIFMQQLQQSLIAIAREHESLRLNYPFNFIWDEFGNFPKYPAVTSLLGAGRSRGIRLDLVVQGYDQLESTYGHDTARSIKNGCMNKIYLLSSDTSTLDEISKSAGHKLVKKDGKYVKEPIFTNERLSKFQYGEILLLRQKENPFYTKMIPNNKYVYYHNSKHTFADNPKKVAGKFDISAEYERYQKTPEYRKRLKELQGGK